MTFRQRFARMTGKDSPFAAEPGLESIYRDLFLRELDKLGEADRFFPVGGAANYSLLYAILRVATEFRPRTVLDVGAGQSTLLWAMLQGRGLVGAVLTLEGDAIWGARVAAQVPHEILVTPLSASAVNGRETMTYDWDRVRERGPFEVMLCDGPNGVPRHSRCGILSLLGATLPEDFLLILDDAERPGEQDTVRAIHREFQLQARPYDVGVIRAAKTQVLFAGGRFVPATFL